MPSTLSGLFSGFCSTCNHLCAYTLSKGREPRKGESDDPGDVSCDSRYRHHRGVLRYRHPVVVVDASLGRLYTMGSESCPLAGLRPFLCSPPVLTPQDRPSLPAANFHIILGDALPRSGGPYPLGPGLSGVSEKPPCRQLGE
jgi:hypothetical protein